MMPFVKRSMKQTITLVTSWLVGDFKLSDGAALHVCETRQRLSQLTHVIHAVLLKESDAFYAHHCQGVIELL